jgi:hypothetical protein
MGMQLRRGLSRGSRGLSSDLLLLILIGFFYLYSSLARAYLMVLSCYKVVLCERLFYNCPMYFLNEISANYF